MDASRPDEPLPPISETPPTHPTLGDELGGVLSEQPPQPPRKGWNILAWPIILAVVGVALFGQPLLERADADARQTQSGTVRAVLELQGRYLVGAKELLGLPGDDLLRQIQALDDGSPDAKLRLAVLAGEFVGPQEAQQRLALIQAASDEDRKVVRILSNVYWDQVQGLLDLPSLAPNERSCVSRRAARLVRPAGAPSARGRRRRGPSRSAPRAQQTVMVLLGGVCSGGLLAFGGFVGLIVLLVLAVAGKLRPGLQPGLPHAGVYAETFALWLLMFVGLTLLGAHVFQVPDLLRSGLLGAASLVVLVWPVLRGVSWPQVRQDIGLHGGRSGALEPGWGILGYFMTLPLVIIGLFLTFLLMAWQRHLQGGPALPLGQSTPAHPIIEFLIHGDAATRWQVFALACIEAPIVEEIMFRGVLYRNVRELTHGAGRGWSIVVSGLLVSFLFAAIHPQGWVAIPLLMCLSFGMGIMREWRGSLIAPMVVHALSNGIVLGMLLLALG